MKRLREKTAHAKIVFTDEVLISFDYLRLKIDSVRELNSELKKLKRQIVDDVVKIENTYRKQLADMDKMQSVYLNRVEKETRVRHRPRWSEKFFQILNWYRFFF